MDGLLYGGGIASSDHNASSSLVVIELGSICEAGYSPLCALLEIRARRYLYREVCIKSVIISFGSLLKVIEPRADSMIL